MILPLNDVSVKMNGTVVDVTIDTGPELGISQEHVARLAPGQPQTGQPQTGQPHSDDEDAVEYSGASREYRIDELARVAGTTVRNVRAYQDRGLLPPSRRQGRVAFYSEAHLARLRLVTQLLERGYTLSNIRELIEAWQSGQDVGDLLGLEAALAAPWTDETPMMITAEELTEMFGDEAASPDVLQFALSAGVIELVEDGRAGDTDGDADEATGRSGRFLVRKPRLLHVGAELVASGIPLRAVLGLGRELREEMDRIARSFVALAVEHVFEPVGERIPAEEVPRLTDVVRRIRPLAKDAVDAELADAMERHVHAELRVRLQRMLDDVETPRTEAS
jgi:DNA-binding transcriptional MerR regulator